MPQFEAALGRRGGGHVVALPFDAKEVFGRVRAPVRVMVNGHSFRTTTMRYGGVAYVGLIRDVRVAAGVSGGDRLELTIDVDDEPREVDVPAELERALAGSAPARSAFASLSYTHRREYARWITEAKREETRLRRSARAVEMLESGFRTPDAPGVPPR